MNTRKLLVSVLMLTSVLFSACAPAATATPPAPTAVPPTTVPTVVPTTVVSTAPPTAKVIAEWKVSNPGSIAVGFDSIWVAGHSSLTTTRINPASNQVIAVIKGTGTSAEQVLAAGDVLWVMGQHDDTVWIDSKTNTVSTTVPPVQGQHHYIVYGFNSVWATTSNDRLDRIDPATNQIIVSIELGDGIVDSNNELMSTAASIWVDHQDEQELIKIDPATNSILSKTPYSKLISDAQALATVPAGKGADFIWRLTTDGLLRMDPTTGAGLTFLPLNSNQNGFKLAVGEDSVWLAGDGQINRVNVVTNQIDETYATDPGFINITIGFGSVWLSNYYESLVQRLDVAP